MQPSEVSTDTGEGQGEPRTDHGEPPAGPGGVPVPDPPLPPIDPPPPPLPPAPPPEEGLGPPTGPLPAFVNESCTCYVDYVDGPDEWEKGQTSYIWRYVETLRGGARGAVRLDTESEAIRFDTYYVFTLHMQFLKVTWWRRYKTHTAIYTPSPPYCPCPDPTTRRVGDPALESDVVVLKDVYRLYASVPRTFPVEMAWEWFNKWKRGQLDQFERDNPGGGGWAVGPGAKTVDAGTIGPRPKGR